MRIQEQGCIVMDLQHVVGLENTCFRLLSLVETPWKRLRSSKNLETASKGDFELTLFLVFFRFCSSSSASFQPLFWSARSPYVSHNALGLILVSKSLSINALDIDLIPFNNLPNLASFQSFCTHMAWCEFEFLASCN